MEERKERKEGRGGLGTSPERRLEPEGAVKNEHPIRCFLADWWWWWWLRVVVVVVVTVVTKDGGGGNL